MQATASSSVAAAAAAAAVFSRKRRAVQYNDAKTVKELFFQKARQLFTTYNFIGPVQDTAVLCLGLGSTVKQSREPWS